MSTTKCLVSSKKVSSWADGVLYFSAFLFPIAFDIYHNSTDTTQIVADVLVDIVLTLGAVGISTWSGRLGSGFLGPTTGYIVGVFIALVIDGTHF